MAVLRAEVLEGVYSPTTGATTNLGRLVPPRPGTGMTVPGKIAAAMSCRVVTAGNGTGTVSFGTTTGGTTALMSTAEVGAGATGRKVKTHRLTADRRVPGAAEEFITGTYVVGTNTVHPVIKWRAVLIDDDQADKKLLVA